MFFVREKSSIHIYITIHGINDFMDRILFATYRNWKIKGMNDLTDFIQGIVSRISRTERFHRNVYNCMLVTESNN